MLYFAIQIVIYIIFIALSNNQRIKERQSGTLTKVTLIAAGSVILSFLVELPIRLTALTLINNKWLYITVILAVALCKIVIPVCALLTMSRLFGNLKTGMIVLIVTAAAVIASFTMNTYEAIMYFRFMEKFQSGQIDFFSVVTGGPITYNFGKIHLLIEYIPALLQMIMSLSHGDKVSSDPDNKSPFMEE